MNLINLEEFGKAFIPRKLRPSIRIYLAKAGLVDVPYKLFGGLFYFSVGFTALIYILFVWPILQEMNVSTLSFLFTTFIMWIVAQLALLILIMAALYIYYDLKIFNRTKLMENVLQDFLRYLSENLKGGMAFDKALWSAIRPKFGILGHEIRLTAKKVMTGQDIEDALLDFTEKYDSPMLKRSFNLIIEGMRGGGEIASLIDKIESNIRRTREIKSELVATNQTYVIFLTAIALVISPLLFGMSFNLLIILQTISSKLAGGAVTSSNLPFNVAGVSVDPNQFKIFSMYALAATSMFSAMIVSIIKSGNIKQGLKYIPIYVIISLVMYTIFRILFTTMFGGIAF